jgi:hypothetical protein
MQIEKIIIDNPDIVNYVDWNKICQSGKLSLQFIQRYENYIKWNILLRHNFIDLKFIECFSGYINYKILLSNVNITEEVKEILLKKLPPKKVIQNVKLQHNIIENILKTCDSDRTSLISKIIKYQNVNSELISMLSRYGKVRIPRDIVTICDFNVVIENCKIKKILHYLNSKPINHEQLSMILKKFPAHADDVLNKIITTSDVHYSYFLNELTDRNIILIVTKKLINTKDFLVLIKNIVNQNLVSHAYRIVFERIINGQLSSVNMNVILPGVVWYDISRSKFQGDIKKLLELYSDKLDLCEFVKYNS